MRGRLAALATLLLLLAGAPAVRAHESLPVYLELTETAAGRFEVLWRVPATQAAPPALAPALPDSCRPDGPPRLTPQPGALVGRLSVACAPPGLAAGRVGLAGLERTVLDALVRIDFADGRQVAQVIRPGDGGLEVAAARGATAAGGYFLLGVEHILLGIDHLLFVAGLVLLVRGMRRLAATVTAFTLAHSLTLALAALGVVHVPGPPVEATIALSILFLARELLRRGRGDGRADGEGLMARAPWLVAFSFGLLHGLGFAGALADIGLPQGAIPLALFLFNLGVEAGQLLFVAALLLAGTALRRMPLPPWSTPLPAYGIGALAAFWLIERLGAVMT